MSRMERQTVLVMAGGTGGHVFPALAVAEQLQARGREVIWLGTRAGIEARIVPAAGIAIEWLPVTGLRGKGGVALLLAPARLLRSCFAAWQVLRRVKPAVVLGMGGFASGPGGVVAWLTGRPLIVHEQNAIAGMTNRILSRLAKRVLVAFPGTLSSVAKEEVVGNPVRQSVTELPEPKTRFTQRQGALRVLVLGGSQGARALNEIVPAALAAAALDVKVVHQCGRGDAGAVRTAYASAGLEATVESFIEDMASAYADADIAICRAGAMTVFELAAAGLGSILVPFPHAVDDHQTANARYLADAGAARVIQERDMTADRLAAQLRELGSRERLLELAVRAREMARPRATQCVAQACADLAGGAA